MARRADEWNCWGLPETIAHKSAVLERSCEAIGRDPAEIVRSAQALIVLENDPSVAAHRLATSRMPAFGGTLTQVADTVEEYARIGLDELVVQTSSLGTGARLLDVMDRLMGEVFRR